MRALKGASDFYASGDWNAVCYECGRKFKASALKRHWQGYYVCKAHWEPRQPQDFVRGVNEVLKSPWSQPLNKPVFVPTANVVWVSDTLTMSEGMELVKNGSVTLADTLSVSETTAVSLTTAAADTLTMSESITAAAVKAVSDTLTMSESIIATSVMDVSDTLTMSESITAAAALAASDTLSMTENVNATIIASVADSLSMSESVAVSLVSGLSRAVNGAPVNTTQIN
jgi:hypothetical protein